jgi:hypothetical protein
MVESLLKHGAKPDARDRNGITALLQAAHVGALDVVEILVRHGADITVVDNLGSSVLEAARTPALHARQPIAAGRPGRRRGRHHRHAHDHQRRRHPRPGVHFEA